jgi:hypothetical protein
VCRSIGIVDLGRVAVSVSDSYMIGIVHPSDATFANLQKAIATEEVAVCDAKVFIPRVEALNLTIECGIIPVNPGNVAIRTSN